MHILNGKKACYVGTGFSQKLQGLRVAANDEGVQVKVDDVRGADLVQILADMRSEYENITQKSRADIEAIYQTQVTSEIVL